MTGRGSFITGISSDSAQTLNPYRRYPWIGVVVSFFVSVASSFVYPGIASASAWVSAFFSRFIALTLLILFALGAHQLRLSIMRWRKTLQVTGFPSFEQTVFLLECKARRQSYAVTTKRRLARFGPLLGMEDDDEEDVLAEAERFRVLLPIILLCIIPMLAGLVGVFAVLVFYFNVLLLLLSMVLLIWGTRIGLDFILPPTILFLGVSQEEQIELQAKLTFLCFPLYLISYLDEKWIYNEQDKPKTPFHAGMQYSALRSSDGSYWEEAVMRWLEIIPLVIVDCRVRSPAVTQEIDWIIASRRSYNAVFVIDASDTSLPPEIIWKAKVLTEVELMEFMSYSLTSHLHRLRRDRQEHHLLTRS